MKKLVYRSPEWTERFEHLHEQHAALVAVRDARFKEHIAPIDREIKEYVAKINSMIPSYP